MPLLLEDLAEDAVVNLSRTADRFDAAAKELARPDVTGDEVARFARHLTAYAIAELPQAEAVWEWEADQPLKEPAEVERRQLALRTVFALQARLCVIARRAWQQAETLGVAPERSDELHTARWRFERLARHMTTAIEHRKHGWQPQDPERFTETMRQIAEGRAKTVTADEARKWFRPTHPPGGEG